MKIAQTLMNPAADDIAAQLAPLQSVAPDLVLVFGDVAFFRDAAKVSLLKAAFPKAVCAGCSTAGEISAEGVTDGRITVTVIHFDKIRFSAAMTTLADMADSHAAGERLGKALAGQPDLRAVLVYGPGVDINGSAVVKGLSGALGVSVPITGGLAGDGGAFRETWTLGPDGAQSRGIVAIAFSGDALRFAHGSFGGWEPFGPMRKVTRSKDNVLFELDGEPALEVYKRYLGQYAKDLPASGLLFPFLMAGAERDPTGLIRTILAVDEQNGSVTLAGDIDPEGYLKLMHSNTDQLVGGAEAAAEAAHKMAQDDGRGLVLLVSCVGRKLVMGERVDEEIEAVADVFGGKAAVTGFYSYGEISPFVAGGDCRLHNQTMTVTYINEV